MDTLLYPPLLAAHRLPVRADIRGLLCHVYSKAEPLQRDVPLAHAGLRINFWTLHLLAHMGCCIAAG